MNISGVSIDLIFSDLKALRQKQEREKVKAEAEALLDEPLWLVPKRFTRVRTGQGEIVYMVSLVSIEGLRLDGKAGDVTCFFLCQENHGTRFRLAKQNYEIEAAISGNDFDRAAEWIETQTRTPDWSVAQRIDRRTRRGPLVFSFSCKESAALFKLMFSA